MVHGGTQACTQSWNNNVNILFFKWNILHFLPDRQGNGLYYIYCKMELSFLSRKLMTLKNESLRFI